MASNQRLMLPKMCLYIIYIILFIYYYYIILGNLSCDIIIWMGPREYVMASSGCDGW